jgi:hypothetical protein
MFLLARRGDAGPPRPQVQHAPAPARLQHARGVLSERTITGRANQKLSVAPIKGNAICSEWRRMHLVLGGSSTRGQACPAGRCFARAVREIASHPASKTSLEPTLSWHLTQHRVESRYSVCPVDSPYMSHPPLPLGENR